MRDEYKINSHKLHYHVDRVARWQKGENVYPIYMEIGLTQACNHRCIFCAFDYVGYESVMMKTERICELIRELEGLGVKSIMYAGEGETLLHKDISKIIKTTKDCGIDVAMETNGVLFNDEKIEEIIPNLTWIRVSLNAGTPESYALIHGTDKKDFNKVLDNLKKMVDLKKTKKLTTTIGAQMLLLPQNYGEPLILAEHLKKAGLNYFSVKPYIQHPQSMKRIDIDYQLEKIRKLETELSRFDGDGFRTILRETSLKKLKEKKQYDICYGLPFFAEITSNGDVYTCGPFLYNKDFCYGNIYKNSFKEIWEGEQRKKILERIETNHDIKTCMRSCRLDEINKYLWNLKNPPEHINFI